MQLTNNIIAKFDNWLYNKTLWTNLSTNFVVY